MSTSRIQALTDGVFAIVMTLLVFELQIPAPGQAFPDALLDLGPNLLSYVISFVILGTYWAGHHAQFQYIERADQPLLWFNILFLMFISLIPFSAGLLAFHNSERWSAIVYGVNLICVALAHDLVWWYATRDHNAHHLCVIDLNDDVIQLGMRISLTPVVFYVLAILLALISPALSIAIYLLVPLPYVFGFAYRARAWRPPQR